MAEAQADGLAIRYDDLGQGEPALLCLPGWCASRVAFDELARQASAHRRVLSLDWRGHGHSDTPPGDFGSAQLLHDALAVMEASRARQVVPLATAHAGWIAIELRRALGAARIPKLILVDWIVTTAPPPFLGALAGLQDPAQSKSVRDQLFAMWTKGVDDPAVLRFVHEDMGRYGSEMWARAGREIAAAYAREGSGLAALARLAPPAPTLHLYGSGADPASAEAQAAFAADHPWFEPQAVDARSHFPTLELPDQLVARIERFLA